MADFGTKKFKDDKGNIYGVSLSLNDAAIMDDHLEMVVTGTFLEAGAEVPLKVEFLVRLNSSEEALEVYFEGERRGIINLAAIEAFNGEEFEDLNTEEAWSQLSSLLEDRGEALEALINSFPTPDPVFGCLLRAGLSTAVGQIIACYLAFRQIENIRQRISNVLRCLAVNSLVMLSKFTWRTFKCALGAGLIPL